MVQDYLYNMEAYLTEFNYINNTKLVIGDLCCFECENFFNTTLYSKENQNICQDCYKKAGTDLQESLSENIHLKKQLKGAQFPCKFDQCDFKGRLPEFHKHINACFYGPMLCPIDNKELPNIDALIKHLSVHEEIEKRVIETLTVEVDMNVESAGKKIILAVYLNHYFFVIVHVTDATVSFTVAKHMSTQCSSIERFTVLYRNGTTNPSQQGDIQSAHTLFKNAIANKITFNTSLFTADAQVIIFLSHYEKLKTQVNDCRICCHALLGKLRQCANGHCICAPCASKITACPVCRQTLLTSNITFKHLFPSLLLPCENWESGCVELIDVDKTDTHNKECAFQQTACPECKADVLKKDLYAHFNNKHKPNYNFSVLPFGLEKEEAQTSWVYIAYRSRVFRLNRKYAASLLQFGVELVVDVGEAGKYRYEIVLMKNNDVIAKVGNVCSTQSTALDSTLKLTECFKHFSKGTYQCNILKIC